MKQLKDWYCDFTLNSDVPLTVGQKFALLCKGSTPLDESLVPTLEIKDEKHEYDLVLLEHKYKSSYEIFIPATSWKIGNHSYKNLKLKLGEEYISIDGPNVKVETTLTDQNQKMNLPPGPMLKTLPEAMWYIFGVLLFIMIVWGLKLYRQSVKLDRGMLKLQSFKTSLSPFFEFQKQIRLMKKTLERKLSYSELYKMSTTLYKHLVIYVSFQIDKPLFVLTDQEIKNYLNKKISDPNLTKEYFYLIQEIKTQTLDFKKESESKSSQEDLEGLLEEANDFSKKVNKYFIGVNRV